MSKENIVKEDNTYSEEGIYLLQNRQQKLLKIL